MAGFVRNMLWASHVWGNSVARPGSPGSDSGAYTQQEQESVANPVATTGSSFADFLLGLPQETNIESARQKAYMRQNNWDLFVGPGTQNVTLSLSRNFHPGEGKSLELRATANNALNIVQYAGVNIQFDSTSNGQVDAFQPMRQITFLAQFSF
jgi:hypothetical protein